MNKSVTFDATVEKLETRKDKTIKLTLGTQELNPKDSSTLFGFVNKFCKVLLKPEDEEITEADISGLSAPDMLSKSQGKSSSKRLRDVLFVLWNQDNKGWEDFNDFYQNRIELFIEQIKDKLD